VTGVDLEEVLTDDGTVVIGLKDKGLGGSSTPLFLLWLV
jgi:hypothetical protein